MCLLSLRGCSGLSFLGEPSWRVAGLFLPCPGCQRASTVSCAALSSRSPTQTHLGSSGRRLSVSGAIPVSWALSPLVSARTERKQMSCWRASSAPHTGRGLPLFTEANCCCCCSSPAAVGSALPLPRADPCPQPAQPVPPAEARSRIPADFHGGAVYLWEQLLLLPRRAPHPSPLSSGLACSIPGVAVGTDRGVTGVGRSGGDSDFIVQLCGPGRAPQSPGPGS